MPNLRNFDLCILAVCLLGLVACLPVLDQEYSVADVPMCAEMSRNKVIPQRLSQTCLYSDIHRGKISDELDRFTPNYQLWSDGANKTRWIYLPAGTQVDTEDPDRWVFPMGTQVFKEFRKTDPVMLTSVMPAIEKGIKVETRHLMKIKAGTGPDAWSMVAYAWQQDQQDALLLTEGAEHVLGTNHSIPSQEDCITCHKGNTDILLGFDAIQLSDKQERYAFGHGPKRSEGELTLQTLIDQHLMTKPVQQSMLPGEPFEQKVLGYLHANCGNCHNPIGHAAEQEADHLKFRHKLAFKSVEETDVYKTAVNQSTQNFTIVPYIAMGAAHEEMALYNSALYVRMNSTDEDYRMPMIAREVVDYDALALMHQWLLSIATPEDYDFGFDKMKLKKTSTVPKKNSSPLEFTHEKGLQLNIQFERAEDVPPVMIIYWPEDMGLQASPVMDHKDGYFTEKMIVGSQGSTMSLRNSDDVGHTIYVKDKRRNIRWQLNYMPPGSSFEQGLFWEEDTFVEMRCRLHLYMSAWAGSISSRYYKIVEFEQGQTQAQVLMKDYPEKFTELKVWQPKYKPIHTQVDVGEEQRFDLIKGNKAKGTLDIKRLAQ